MLYALLAYHEEGHIQSWSEAEDQAVMARLEAAHQKLAGQMGPAARLGATSKARTVRDRGLVIDGPFAETKEQLLGFYIVEADDMAGAVAAAEELKAANTTAAYEIRPIVLFRPGKAIPLTDAGLADVR